MAQMLIEHELIAQRRSHLRPRNPQLWRKERHSARLDKVEGLFPRHMAHLHAETNELTNAHLEELGRRSMETSLGHGIGRVAVQLTEPALALLDGIKRHRKRPRLEKASR